MKHGVSEVIHICVICLVLWLQCGKLIEGKKGGEKTDKEAVTIVQIKEDGGLH